MKRTAEELLSIARAILGDSTEDAVLSFYEDIADSVSDSNDTEEEVNRLRAEMADQDRIWRERYRDRFLNGGESNESDDTDEETEESAIDIRIDDLFNERNKNS